MKNEYSDYQKESIKNICDMFSEGKKKKVLLADEVGLGKTLIAAGVMEKLLCSEGKYDNAMYIAPSNRLISENVKKIGDKSSKKCFNPLSSPGRSNSNRPIHTFMNQVSIESNKINLFASTAGILFFTKTKWGDDDERYGLYCIIKTTIDSGYFTGETEYIKKTLEEICNRVRLLRPLLGSKIEPEVTKRIKENKLHHKIINQIHEVLLDNSIYNFIDKDFFEKIGDGNRLHDLNINPVFNFIRMIVNIALIDFYGIKMIVLDEFHNYFRDEQRAALELILNYTDCRLLMLSATPYSMNIAGLEDDEEDDGARALSPAFENFQILLSYLLKDEKSASEKLDHYVKNIKRFAGLNSFDRERWDELISSKDDLQELLGSVISRNERSVCYDGEAIVDEDIKTDEDGYASFKCEVDIYRKALSSGDGDVPPLGYVKEIPDLYKYASDYKKVPEISQYEDYSNDSFLLGTLKKEIEDMQLSSILWMPPSCDSTKHSISKILVFAMYRASAVAIKDLLNRCYNNNPPVNPGFDEESIDRFTIGTKYLKGTYLDGIKDYVEKLDSCFKEYFRKNIDVIKRSDCKDIEEYCQEYRLKEVLEEYYFVLDRDAEKLINGLESSLSSDTIVEAFEKKGTTEEGAEEQYNITDRFQSPFYPFVLAATSSVQEGIDLHNYCHEVMHWHIPASPVDFEQREGRVDRRISYLVRKRAVAAGGEMRDPTCDGWDELFSELEKEYKNSDDDFGGLIPYWYIPSNRDDSVKIRRIVAYHKHSKEEKKYKRLIDAKNYYRLSLGNGIDVDLLDSLKKRVDQAGESVKLEDLFLRLNGIEKRKL